MALSDSAASAVGNLATLDAFLSKMLMQTSRTPCLYDADDCHHQKLSAAAATQRTAHGLFQSVIR